MKEKTISKKVVTGVLAVTLVFGAMAGTGFSKAAGFNAAMSVSAEETGDVSEEITDLAQATVNQVEPQTYIGDEITPYLTVMCGEKLVLNGRDYTVSYSDNTEIGTATATITGKGKYTGTKEITFDIVARESDNVRKGKIIARQINPYAAVVYWVPNFAANGTEIMYSADEDFAENKVDTVTGYGKNFYPISNSRATEGGYDNSKKLFVKVRSFIYVDGEKKYGAWSNIRAFNPYVK